MTADDAALELDSDDLLVLPPDDESGYALVLGRTQLPAELGETLDEMPEALVGRAIQPLTKGMRFAGAFDADHGRWVRLTSETAAQISKHGGLARDGGGLPLGVVRGADGKFAHMTRFDFVSPVPFDPATFAAALAVQQVVRQLEERLEAIAQDVEALVRSSKIDLEAKLAGATATLVRIERRVRDRGFVDDDDWASLATLEPVIKEAYQQTFLWLQPLKQFLADERLSLTEQVKALRGNVGIRDAEFFLRLHVHSELALKRWDVMWLIREAVAAPERLAEETRLVREAAAERHSSLVDMITTLDRYLGDDPEPGALDRLRFISRHRLARLRFELAQVANAYAESLQRQSIATPEVMPAAEPGPLIDLDAARAALAERAAPALRSGAESTRSALTKLGRGTAERFQRVRERGADDE